MKSLSDRIEDIPFCDWSELFMEKMYLDSQNYEEFIYYLVSIGEEEYRDFCSKITPDLGSAIGIRMPILKNIGKKLSKNSNIEEMIELLNREDYYEVKLLQGMLIGKLDPGNVNIFTYIDEYILRINNWALCDSFISSLRQLVLKNKEEFYRRVKLNIQSENPWEVRFGLIILNCYFNSEKYIDDILSYVIEAERDHYYVKMGIAWLISTIYFTDKTKVKSFLQTTHMDKWCVNKSIQKICESLKASGEEKIDLKKLKR